MHRTATGSNWLQSPSKNHTVCLLARCVMRHSVGRFNDSMTTRNRWCLRSVYKVSARKQTSTEPAQSVSSCCGVCIVLGAFHLVQGRNRERSGEQTYVFSSEHAVKKSPNFGSETTNRCDGSVYTQYQTCAVVCTSVVFLAVFSKRKITTKKTPFVR